jgi:hypothetical protein
MRRGDRLGRSRKWSVTLAVLLLGGAGYSCATFRLGGCNRIAACGELAAYACETDLVCSDSAGRTVWSEPLGDAKQACHVCALHAR